MLWLDAYSTQQGKQFGTLCMSRSVDHPYEKCRELILNIYCSINSDGQTYSCGNIS